ncbi:hypothetical protein [Pectobacterium sp. F1-1]|uniref:hypothetical protein n=1 Tax=Pectobacterium sp. F1-1 TaxID=2949614 RepID=UPI0021D7AA67|nr:hypothetical protein [Pectobacterium sp. F1-1]
MALDLRQAISSTTSQLTSGEWLMAVEKEGDLQKSLNGIVRRVRQAKKKPAPELAK